MARDGASSDDAVASRAVGLDAFPYHRLPRVGRAEAALLSRLSPRAACPPPQVRRTARSLLGVELEVRPHHVVVWTAEQARTALESATCCALLEHRRADRSLSSCVELPSTLASTLLDRMLGGDGDAGALADGPPGEMELGVLSYLAARLCATSEGTLLREMTTEVGDLLPALGEPPLVACALSVRLGPVHGPLRVVMNGATATRLLARDARSATPPSAIARLPLAVDVIAGRASLARSALHDLARGDIVLPLRCELEAGPEGFVGRVELQVRGSRRTRWLCSTAGSRITIEEREHARRDVPTTGGRTMEGSDDREESPRSLAGDAPVEVELSLARFTLTLDELSALAPGQVLTTGRPIGQLATLRAAGRAIARGELVVVEGEIGLRITEGPDGGD